MMPILAAMDGTKISYRFSRLQSMSEWWHWLLMATVCLVVASYIIWVYRRDGEDLPRPVCALLIVLRLLAFVGMLMFFFDLEKRSERSVVKNSRLIVLVDTSQSMALPDGDPTSTAGPSRIARVKEVLAQGTWLRDFRKQHDVAVYRFDQGAKPTEVAAYSQLESQSEPNLTLETGTSGGGPRAAKLGLLVAGVFAIIAAVAGIMALAKRRPASASGEPRSWALLVAMLSGIATLVILAVINLRYPEIDLRVVLGLTTSPAPLTAQPNPTPTSDIAKETVVDWDLHLKTTGFETRIGDAIKFIVGKERGGSIAGIVLLTDGAQNAGGPAAESVALARQAGIAVFPVGLGSEKRPINLRVVDLEAPPRVYPGDRFTVTGYLQAYGFAGRTVKVELSSRVAENPNAAAPEKFEEEQRVKLPADGEVAVLRFEVTPDEQGRREFKLKVSAPEQDLDDTDNQKMATVQIVERRSRVLLVAGGPMHDFQFLRNMLFRDKSVDVDVLLQIGKPGISQEADEVLFEFPKTADELFRYDAIVAFDPDWTALDELQVDLLDRWLAEKAGGLIVVAGTVNTARWASRIRSDPRLDKIQALYPVVFYSRGAATLSLGKFGSSSPWPLQFTRDGLEGEFLWLEDTPLDSQKAWESFPGVYGYYAVKDAKPGARVFARFSDPDASLDREQPVYMAGHFYGAGRVFFMGSGEIWRMRGIHEKYFEAFYTKLIRWISQGRLLRDSSRGVLLVEKDRCLLGDEVEIRAMLNDAQHQPLQAESVQATVSHSDGTRIGIVMRRLKDSPRQGTYFGSFSAQKIGDYRIELRPPDSPEEEMLTREIRVLAPQLETEKPERNDALLAEIADKTGGKYYVGLDTALGQDASRSAPLVNIIDPRDQVTYLPGTPDRDFEQHLMTWLMCLICGVLCLEWLVRRLGRLA